MKQTPRAYGTDTVAQLRDSFIASGYNLRTLIADIATLAALHGTAPTPLAATSTRHSP